MQHVELVGHHPAKFRIGLVAIDGEALIPGVVIGFDGGEIVGGADEDIVLCEDGAHCLIHGINTGPGFVYIING